MHTRHRFPIRITFALAAILAGLFTAPSAPALSLFYEIPSTTWGYTYASGPSAHVTSPPTAGANLERQSTFIVNYNNFPAWAKTDVQAAIDVWSANFSSTVPISVEATWGKSSSSAILGSARPGNYFSSFKNAPDSTLWYPSALANAIAGEDLDPSSPEIVIQANSDASWDPRNDGTPTKSEYDLESVFIHELGHGLGFLSTSAFDPYFKFGILDQPTVFDAYAQTPDGRRLSDIQSPSRELGLALTNTLAWSGPLGTATNNGIKPLLYTPSRYEIGSSISHLDEATFSASSFNSIMTPDLSFGEVFRSPGPLLIAMLDDLRNKPPAGLSSAVPLPPQNAAALVGDRSTLITFGLPANVRSAQIAEYRIKNEKTGEEIAASGSPVLISGLKNGVSYSFSITAKNSLGQSDPVLTNQVIPQAAWKAAVLDSASDGKHITSTLFRTQPAIVYTASKTKDLKVALWTGKIWKKITVDGRGGTLGRTLHDTSGPISVCTSGSGMNQILHIFYTDLVDKDLRHATYDGTKFKYEIVDGNGPIVQPYDQASRVRTASDVSVSNACAITATGIQVFYRDESQGILLGAFKGASGKWTYELVDGDRKSENRTTGDVGTHLSAVAVGSRVSVLYDSVLQVNQQKQVIAGEIRLATRTGNSTQWSYRTLDTSSGPVAVAGYAVSLNKTADGVIATWLTASRISIPRPTQIRWNNLSDFALPTTITTESYGLPTSPLSVDNRTLIFGCESRICAADLKPNGGRATIRLISNALGTAPPDSAWVIVNRVRYAVTSVAGKITLLRP
ncbi:MAG: fibronectin type III domain-containing protein [Actinobacteria bacterium]|nr:fibronectin type III domain-containing protein [Actinomycetota bacterium]